MLDEEMAKRFADSHTRYIFGKRKDGTEYVRKVNDITIQQAFLAGLKAGRPQWHDLLKNKNDLPKLDKTDMSDYVITDKGVAYYNGRVKSWYIQNECILSDDVIAWCEIPTFDKEIEK